MWCKRFVLVCFNYNIISDILKSNKFTAEFVKCASNFTNRLFSDMVPEPKKNLSFVMKVMLNS